MCAVTQGAANVHLDWTMTAAPRKKQKSAISFDMGDPATTDDAAETDDAPTAVAARTVESPGDNTFLVDDLSSVASAVLASSTTSKEQLVFKAVARDEPLAFARRAFGTQTDKARTSGSNFLHHRKCREKERALRLQILRLKQTVDRYKEELRKLKDDCNVSTFLDVATDAQQKSVKTSFIMDDINNYTKKRATWNETTVRSNQWLPNPEIATLALIGGYLARVMAEKLNCQGCIELVEKPNGNAPVDGLIPYQDRGGLKYSTKELVTLLISLSKFVDIVLDYRKQIVLPLETSVEHAVNVLMDLPILKCQNEDRAHRK
ncbi:hypothetical protein HPB49_002982 [Dermacentor silvarum]|uniref:Uncharacterized protein n=1 Tax=Dermacentor silvarum TaxID=543639 RepID=A0ACB8CUP9_DERSI|nr:hypothetical protein HPB49_002982 [Dermacentor silvarum]